MTPRERVLAAIEHREPDRVPIDLGCTPSSGISAIAYGNLKRHLGMNGGHNRVYDVVQQLAQPEDEILDRFGIDVVDPDVYIRSLWKAGDEALPWRIARQRGA